jgi:hypothetical protein
MGDDIVQADLSLFYIRQELIDMFLRRGLPPLYNQALIKKLPDWKLSWVVG